MLSPFQTRTTGTYSLLKTDRFQRCDTSGGAIILNLPVVVGYKDVQIFVKKISNDGSTVTINAPSGKTIDGVASFTLSSFQQAVWICSLSDGNYECISGNFAGLGSVAPIGTVVTKSLSADQSVTNTLTTVATMATISFTLAQTGDVTIEAAGRFTNGVSNFFGGTVGVRLNGTDYILGNYDANNGSGGDINNYVNTFGFRTVHLAAGSYTAEFLASSSPSGVTLKAGASFKITIEGTGGAITLTGQQILKNGSVVSTGERDIDFVEGALVTLTVTDVPGSNKTTVQIDSSGGSSALYGATHLF